VEVAKKENHVDGDKIRALLFSKYLSQATKIQKKKKTTKIEEEKKEEIPAERINSNPNMEIEDGALQHFVRTYQTLRPNPNNPGTDIANFSISQLPSPNYSQSQLSNPYTDFQQPNSEHLMLQFQKLYKFMEDISDDIGNIKRHQASALNTINVLKHDMNKLSDEVLALKEKDGSTSVARRGGRGGKGNSGNRGRR